MMPPRSSQPLQPGRPTTCATCGCRCRATNMSIRFEAPRSRRRRGAEHAAQALPAAPAGAVPPLVPHARCRSRGRSSRSGSGPTRRPPEPPSMMPPRSSQPLQPSRSTTCATCGCRCRARSSRGGSTPRTATAGADVSTPPRFSQPLQRRAVPPLVPHRRCPCRGRSSRCGSGPKRPRPGAGRRFRRGPPSRSSPRRPTTCATCGCRCRATKQSSRFDAHEATAGSSVRRRRGSPTQATSFLSVLLRRRLLKHVAGRHVARTDLLLPFRRLDHLAAGHLLLLRICHARSSSPLNAAVRLFERPQIPVLRAKSDRRPPRQRCQRSAGLSPERGMARPER